MTNHRRRMQTRNRNFNIPPGHWPEHHNEAVKRRKMFRNIGRSLALANRAFRCYAITMQTFATAVDRIAVDIDAAQRARKLAILDRLAANGYDVREDMDALATEEAEATRQETTR